MNFLFRPYNQVKPSCEGISCQHSMLLTALPIAEMWQPCFPHTIRPLWRCHLAAVISEVEMFSNLVTLFWKFSLFKGRERERAEGERTVDGQTTIYHVLSSSLQRFDRHLSLLLLQEGRAKNGKYATSVRPLLKKPARCCCCCPRLSWEPFKGFHACVFIPTAGAGAVS